MMDDNEVLEVADTMQEIGRRNALLEVAEWFRRFENFTRPFEGGQVAKILRERAGIPEEMQ